jgi:hypothetical protein
MVGLVVALPATTTAGPAPPRTEQLRFMWAVAGQESNWDHYARNDDSGAFGKYQIMPSNWPVWAARYLGDARADQTPRNQERVAFAKISDLYRWLGSWKRVAYWWLTGRSDRRERRWSAYARGYVEAVMRLRGRVSDRDAARAVKVGSAGQARAWRLAASDERLRLGVSGRTWPRDGRIEDGVALRVRSSRTRPNGANWILVLTRDGRLGWLPRATTVPALRPTEAHLWYDVTDRGHTKAATDRRAVRPRPQ